MADCRFCDEPLSTVFADLGMSPLSNAYLRREHLTRAEPFYPLTAFVCEACWLVQLPAAVAAEEIFSDYAYFSSFSESWLEHAREYAGTIAARLRLDASSQVIELASNDGYLLQFFKAAGIPILGVEPAGNVAREAIARGIPTEIRFFGVETARELVARGARADLLIANNVLAHVPDLNDFVEGCRIVLAESGTITMEFPHLLRLIEGNQFDTIYHEHFSYFSLATAIRVFAAHGLAIFDVDELPTHGGSLRIYAAHEGRATASANVEKVLRDETAAGLTSVAAYTQFGGAVQATKRALLAFLVDAKNAGKRIAGYGAPAKGNTLLNYCGVRDDFLDYTVDRSPHKQGLYLPGTHIAIRGPEEIARTRPDYLLILPWNLRDEIMSQMAHIREWGGRFVVAIPRVQVEP